jgi:hypothetical protein
MAAKKRKTFMQLLFSPLTLGPLMLGAGGGIVLWVMGEQYYPLAGFSTSTGSLLALGSFLTRLVLNIRTLDPAVARKRQEMRRLLEELADTARFAPAPEPTGKLLPPAPSATNSRRYDTTRTLGGSRSGLKPPAPPRPPAELH